MKTSPSYRQMEVSVIAEKLIFTVSKMIQTIRENSSDYYLTFISEDESIRIENFQEWNRLGFIYENLNSFRSIKFSHNVSSGFYYYAHINNKSEIIMPYSILGDKKKYCQESYQGLEGYISKLSQTTRKKLLKGILKFESTGSKWALRSLMKHLNKTLFNLQFIFLHNDRYRSFYLNVSVKEEMDMIYKCQNPKGNIPEGKESNTEEVKKASYIDRFIKLFV